MSLAFPLLWIGGRPYPPDRVLPRQDFRRFVLFGPRKKEQARPSRSGPPCAGCPCDPVFRHLRQLQTRPFSRRALAPSSAATPQYVLDRHSCRCRAT